MGAVLMKENNVMSINWSDIDKSVIIHEPEPLILTPEYKKYMMNLVDMLTKLFSNTEK